MRAGEARDRRAGIRPFVLALALVLLAASFVPAAADGTAQALETAGWSETSPGLFMSLPQRTAEIQASGIRGDFVLSPGTSLAWERRYRGAPGPGSVLDIEVYADGANTTSRDYRGNRASFPVSVTAVFGRDSLKLSVKRRILDFLAGFWYGFRPGGVLLTYAAANVAPVGSMYRTSDEETVFVLVGEEERGRRITVRRDLVADFRAAYGRDPKGPVTRLIVRAVRPSREGGPIKAGIGIAVSGK